MPRGENKVLAGTEALGLRSTSVTKRCKNALFWILKRVSSFGFLDIIALIALKMNRNKLIFAICQNTAIKHFKASIKRSSTIFCVYNFILYCMGKASKFIRTGFIFLLRKLRKKLSNFEKCAHFAQFKLFQAIKL